MRKQNSDFNFAEARLKEFGFSSVDLQMCADKGWSPDDVYADVKWLLDEGLTTEQHARETFEEAHEELFSSSEKVAQAPVASLKYDRSDKLKNEIVNFVGIMKSDEKYSGVRFNELTGRAEVHRVENGELTIYPWNDAHEARSMLYIESKYGLYSKDKHSAALRILFEERSYNPIRDIVDGLVWDGEERCQHFLTKWGKVEDTPYTRWWHPQAL